MNMIKRLFKKYVKMCGENMVYATPSGMIPYNVLKKAGMI